MASEQTAVREAGTKDRGPGAERAALSLRSVGAARGSFSPEEGGFEFFAGLNQVTRSIFLPLGITCESVFVTSATQWTHGPDM